jgi:energy-coupling factor transporter ATP-binding protein EcfA2
VELVTEALNGNRYALARLISRVEDGGADARASLAALYPHTGQAHVVGVTGAPGTGKSTLVNELTKSLRTQGTTVGVVAVDPSSPFTGGALLGDRVRMRDLAGDPGVFIRSMATRGSLGGLARATDGRRRPGGGGHCPHGPHDHRHRSAGAGGRGAGAKGRPARDRRRVGGQQGGPSRRSKYGAGARDGDQPKRCPRNRRRGLATAYPQDHRAGRQRRAGGARVGEERLRAWVARITARDVDVYAAVQAILGA